MDGWLKIVGTPIGNLGDLSQRAVETLEQAERIFAEDTRRTKQLLNHLGLTRKKVIAVHAHSSERTVKTAIEMLAEYKVALVTDAGMPAISDPGADLIRGARDAGFEVSVVPGPSAVTSAVALSGLVDGPFSFYGFLPRKGPKRKNTLRLLAESELPVVLFESPHRMAETLLDLRDACGGSRKIAICRELTKRFEETLVEELAVVSEPDYRDEWRGEFSLVIERFSGSSPKIWSEDRIKERVDELLALGQSKKEISAQVSKELALSGQKVSKRTLYQQILAWMETDKSLEQDRPVSTADAESRNS